MGPIKSEYGRRYRDPVWQTYVGNYLENVEYCSQRRQLENRHQPFDWQDSESDTSTEDNEEEEIRDQKGLQQGKQCPAAHGTFKKDKSESVNIDKQTQVEGVAGKPDKTQQNRSVLVPTQKKQLKNKKSRKLKKTKHCEPVEAPSPKKSTKMPSPKKPGSVPFLVYGWADDRRAVGMKQTHNVKASLSNHACVYPSALNAQMRRLLNEEEEQSKKLKRTNSKSNKTRHPYLQIVTPADNWQTEYQRNYSR